MNNKVVIFPIVAVIVVGGIIFFASQKKESPAPVSQTLPTSEPQKEDGSIFAVPKKSAHYESNTPKHGSTLAGVPVNVVIDFNFDLASGSTIQIMNNQKDYGVEGTIIDEGKLAMRRKMDTASPDGLYTVNYKACWADGSCHDGSFQFVIDKKLAQEFVDMTGKKEVTIDLKDITFNPKSVKISKGTKVAWVNQDSVEHTVNTDSHPAHTYYLTQNSRTLKKGDKYSVTFTEAGIYPYHCTPHADSMKGAVLVE